jgi:putative ABC transport system ATP-binding protein
LRLEKIGFVFQAYNLLPVLSALENVEFILQLQGVDKQQRRERAEKALANLGLGDLGDRRPGELSGGQQQRVAVARALASRPTIIFADEPTGNLDSNSGSEVLAFMRRAVDEYGQTIVMVTHDANAAAAADRVLFLNDGKIVHDMSEPTAERILDMMKSIGS